MGIMNDAIDAGTPLYEQLKSAMSDTTSPYYMQPAELLASWSSPYQSGKWSTRDLMNVLTVAQSLHDKEIYLLIYCALHDPMAQHDIVANLTDDEFRQSLDPRDQLWAMGRCVNCCDQPDRCQRCEQELDAGTQNS